MKQVNSGSRLDLIFKLILRVIIFFIVSFIIVYGLSFVVVFVFVKILGTTDIVASTIEAYHLIRTVPQFLLIGMSFWLILLLGDWI